MFYGRSKMEVIWNNFWIFVKYLDDEKVKGGEEYGFLFDMVYLRMCVWLYILKSIWK